MKNGNGRRWAFWRKLANETILLLLFLSTLAATLMVAGLDGFKEFRAELLDWLKPMTQGFAMAFLATITVDSRPVNERVDREVNDTAAVRKTTVIEET